MKIKISRYGNPRFYSVADYVSSTITNGNHGQGELERLDGAVNRMADLFGKMLEKQIASEADLRELGFYLGYGEEVVE